MTGEVCIEKTTNFVNLTTIQNIFTYIYLLIYLDCVK